MSIIAQQTLFTFTNKSKHFLEVRIVAEQDDSFRLDTSDSEYVIPVTTSDVARSNSTFSSLVHMVLKILHGEKLHEIKLNLPAGKTVKASVRCTSSLRFDTKIRSKGATETMAGEFDLGPEYHGDPMRIVWSHEMGYAYTDSGDVSIGASVATKQDVHINSSFYDKKNKKMSGPEVTPACCKVDIL